MAWNPDDWDFTRDTDPTHLPWRWDMDVRHVRFIYDLMMANEFSSVLEIGTYKGFTTSALVQAKKDKDKCFSFDFWTCDTEPQEEAKRLSYVFSFDSLRMLSSGTKYDLVIVDGDHRIRQASRELGLLLYNEVETIIAHDVPDDLAEQPWADGSHFVWRALELHPQYRVRRDAKRRDGELTHRGLMLATKSNEVWERSEEPWRKMVEQ